MTSSQPHTYTHHPDKQQQEEEEQEIVLEPILLHPNETEETSSSFLDIKRRTNRALYGIDSSYLPTQLFFSPPTPDSQDENAVHKSTTTSCPYQSSLPNYQWDTLPTSSSSSSSELMYDKSPKGSVDVLIQPLVHLINAHPEYTTLSSCSGRIAIFDPGCGGGGGGGTDDDGNGNNNGTKTEEGDVNEYGETVEKKEGSNSKSGKGSGGWLLSSHTPISTLQYHSALCSSSSSSSSSFTSSPILFKHEPLLLHISTSSIQTAQYLLKIVLQLGFRESGIITTDYTKKITVAIRSYGLSLTVPIFKTGDEKEEELLVQCANARWKDNFTKLKRLTEVVEGTFFKQRKKRRSMIHNTVQSSTTSTSLPSLGTGGASNLVAHSLPSLNLWNHAAVVVHNNTTTISPKKEMEKDAANIFVFGGCGIGPSPAPPSSSSSFEKKKQENEQTFRNENNINTNNSSTSSSKRWNDIHVLSRKNGIWSRSWKVLKQSSPQSQSQESHDEKMHTVKVKQKIQLQLVPAYMPPLEGHAACLVPPLSSLFFQQQEEKEQQQQQQQQQQESIVLIFGGRSSPSQSPFNTLYIFFCPSDTNEYSSLNGGDSSSVQFYKAASGMIRGKPPLPRWGHSFTSLLQSSSSSSNNIERLKERDTLPLAIVMGGRNEKGHCMNCIHVLSLSSSHPPSSAGDNGSGDGTPHCYFIWSKLDVEMSIPRFHHAAAAIDDDDDDDGNTKRIILFGGLSNPLDTIGSFRAQTTSTKASSLLAAAEREEQRVDVVGDTATSLVDYSVSSSSPPPAVSVLNLKIKINGALSGEWENEVVVVTNDKQMDGTIEKKCTAEERQQQKIEEITSEPIMTVIRTFGSSACCCNTTIMSTNEERQKKTKKSQVILLTGGIPCSTNYDDDDDDDDDCDAWPIKAFQLAKNSKKKKNTEGSTGVVVTSHNVFCQKHRSTEIKDEAAAVSSSLPLPMVDFGSMVHHIALTVPSPSSSISLLSSTIMREEHKQREEDVVQYDDILLLGGGVASFAFRQSYARSYCLSSVDTFSTEAVKKLPDTSSNISSKNKCAPRKQNKSRGSCGKNNNNKTKTPTNVLYVLNKDAKTLKNELEKLSFLDKTFRMVKADPDAVAAVNIGLAMDSNDYIAVPVTDACLTAVSQQKKALQRKEEDVTCTSSWISLVSGIGNQEVLYSSSFLGKMKQ